MIRHAFTLIELLVVIAIIAILAAILFPVFAQAKLSAKKAADLSNTKQLVLATIMYQTDVDDCLPLTVPGDNGTSLFTTPWNRISNNPNPITQAIFANSNAPYIKNVGIWNSPGTQVDWTGLNNQTPNATGFALSYTMNSYLNGLNSSVMVAPAVVPVYWAGMGATDLPGFSFAMPLILTASHSWLQPGQFPGDFYTFSSGGANCVSGFGYFSGPGGTTANYNVFNLGSNISRADGHAKFARNGSTDSPLAIVDQNTGILSAYWVSTVDCFTYGCCYDYILSPLRPQ